MIVSRKTNQEITEDNFLFGFSSFVFYIIEKKYTQTYLFVQRQFIQIFYTVLGDKQFEFVYFWGEKNIYGMNYCYNF